MVLTIREILEAKSAIERLSRNKLPVKVSYRVARSIQKIDKALTVYNQKLIEFMQEHGKLREDGRYYMPPEDVEGTKALTEFHNALLDEPEEINVFKIDLAMLPDSFEIPPYDLIAMSFLIEGDIEGDKEVEEEGGANEA